MMRVRLLIDAEVPDEHIATVAELVAEQPPAILRIYGMERPVDYNGRFMGAQQVLSDGSH